MTPETANLSPADVLAAAFAQRMRALARASDLTVEAAIAAYGPAWTRDVDPADPADLARFEHGDALLEHFQVVESERFLAGADFADWYVKRFARRHRLAGPIVEVIDGYAANTDQARYIALIPRAQ
ncbi:MAG TPA: hypothetical protein VD886_20350 [Herpetosiphonaceae bacterium]|nr:hypothetical protein [Herpetosiphonaceae bacterium]